MESKKFDFPETFNSFKSIGLNVVSDMKNIRFNESVPDNISYDKFVQGLGKLLNEFLEENSNYQIILFPHIYSDLIAIYDLLDNMEDKYRRIRTVVAPYLTGRGSAEYIFGLYKECELVMGMRFHSNVCSIAQNIPTIGLSSYKKINDLYKEIGLINRIVEVNKKGFEIELIELIKETIINKESISKKYNEINKKIYLESKDFYEAMADLFDNNQRD